LAKLDNYRSPRQRKAQNYPVFYLFFNFDLAKGGASAPLAPRLVAPLSALRLCIIIISLEMKRITVGFNLYQKARNCMTKILSI